jgi:hypothetical protein
MCHKYGRYAGQTYVGETTVPSHCAGEESSRRGRQVGSHVVLRDGARGIA